jgi:hypothetical protein
MIPHPEVKKGTDYMIGLHARKPKECYKTMGPTHRDMVVVVSQSIHALNLNGCS